MFELRRKAERVLGKRFDIKRFHEALVGSGSMPLTLLEEHIDCNRPVEVSRPFSCAMNQPANVSARSPPSPCR